MTYAKIGLAAGVLSAALLLLGVSGGASGGTHGGASSGTSGGAEKAKVEADPDLIMRESMVVISRQLGVTCTHCHDASNLKSGKLATFQIAKDHIRVTNWLNSKEGFAGKPRVDCFTCHRGQAHPAYREQQPSGVAE